MKTRTRFFWGILALFVCLAVWWSFYFPYAPDRLYRVVPAEATYISEHQGLAGRWDVFCRNPLSRSVLVAMGMTEAEAEALAEDPDAQALVKRFARKNTVVAYSPSLAGTGRPAWVVASWLGSYGQFLRWGSFAGLLDGAMLSKTKLGGGRDAWLLTPSDPESTQRLSLAVVEGVLVGCYSPDPLGVRYLVSRMERGAAIVPELRERLAAPPDRTTPDRGWVTAAADRHDAPLKLHYGMSRLAAETSEGWMRGDLPDVLRPRAEDDGGFPSPETPSDSDLGAIEELFGDELDSLVLMTRSYADSVVSRQGSVSVQILWKALAPHADPDGQTAVGVLGGEFSGRMLGLKVPAVIWMQKVKDAEQTMAAMTGALDEINARHGWSLLPRREQIGTDEVVVVDTSRSGMLASIGPRERPAFTVRSGWFVFSSNLDTLARLIDRAALSGQAPAGGVRSRWREEMAGKKSLGSAWIDLESGRIAFRNAAAVYTLALVTSNVSGGREVRRELDRLKYWVDAAGTMKTCTLWLTPRESEFEVKFKVGEEG
ncbi:MAG: hypothetical protein HQ559_12145 [Lentisphaerae bacterium]|nr:hypothetical protein [Lentisphaerota bacterium]